jgi:hypothetical protein
MVGFKWDDDQEKAFNLLKERLVSILLLALLNIIKTLEIKCDVSGIDIRTILI